MRKVDAEREKKGEKERANWGKQQEKSHSQLHGKCQQVFATEEALGGGQRED